MKRILLIAFGLLLIGIGVSSGTAKADAIFYETNQDAECASSEIHLIKPMVANGEEHWCVGQVDADEVALATSPNCVQNSPTYQFNGATFCFTNLSQSTATANRPNTDAEGNVKGIPIDCANGVASSCKFYSLLINVINALSALVVIVVVIMLVVGGIQYSSSQNNPQATAAAKKHIANALLALVLYIFMYGFLQWVIPGGLF